MTKDALLNAAKKFSESDCCRDKKIAVTVEDLQALDLWPVPATYDALLGIRVAPLSGLKSLCVYVYEKLSNKPYPMAEVNANGWDASRPLTDLLGAMAAQMP